MYFRVTIPALQDGKRDEAVSYVKEKVMPEFAGTSGLLTMMAAVTGENSGINLSCYESKEALDAAQEQIDGVLAGAANLMAAPPVVYEGDAVYGKVYHLLDQPGLKASLNKTSVSQGEALGLSHQFSSNQTSRVSDQLQRHQGLVSDAPATPRH